MSDTMQIAGELTLNTVASRSNEIEPMLAQFQGQALTLDLSGVSAADSSSLTLLLCWSRLARQNQVELKLTNLPAAMQQLIDVYDLRELLLPKA